MRIVCIIAVFCIFGCSHIDSSKSRGNTEKNDSSLTTLENLVYVDASSADAQHPLVCGAGRDFPWGRELAFRRPESGESVHAVFPKEVTAPEKLDGKFVLHGHFQGIQNMANYKIKKPSKDHRYFVVSSWEYKK